MLFKIFLLLICVLIVCWYTCIYFCYPKIQTDSSTLDISDALSILAKGEFKTGDLIFFSGTTLGEKAIRFYSQSCWSHVGVLLKKESQHSNGEIYIWEFDHDGPHLRLLKDKLEKWKGERIVSCIHTNISEEDIYKSIDKYKDKEFDSSMVKWLIPYFENDKVFCSEMIADLLKLPGRKSSYSPGAIYDLYNKK